VVALSFPVVVFMVVAVALSFPMVASPFPAVVMWLLWLLSLAVGCRVCVVSCSCVIVSCGCVVIVAIIVSCSCGWLLQLVIVSHTLTLTLDGKGSTDGLGGQMVKSSVTRSLTSCGQGFESLTKSKNLSSVVNNSNHQGHLLAVTRNQIPDLQSFQFANTIKDFGLLFLGKNT